MLGGLKFVDHLDRAEADDGDFDPLGRQAVGQQFVLEGGQSFVEFGDRVAAHGPGVVQQQHAGAARLRVVGEFGDAEIRAERGLSGQIEFVHPGGSSRETLVKLREIYPIRSGCKRTGITMARSL